MIYNALILNILDMAEYTDTMALLDKNPTRDIILETTEKSETSLEEALKG